MCQRRIDVKRELGIEVLKCKEIVELIMVVELMKIVADLGPCYAKLVQEFIMNLSTEVEMRRVKIVRECLLEINVLSSPQKLSMWDHLEKTP